MIGTDPARPRASEHALRPAHASGPGATVPRDRAALLLVASAAWAALTALATGCTGDGSITPRPSGSSPDAAALRIELAESMAGNAVLRYSDTWDVLAEGAEVSPGAIRLFYTRRIVPSELRASGADQAEGDYWNREHVWPQSYGLADTDARTDVHNLVPVDRTVNSSRGNKVFDEATTPHHECTVCRVSGEAWEPAPEVQGDVARVAFYMDVRYEGGPLDDVGDLSLSDDSDPDARRFGVLSTLVRWHCADPVSAEEVRRHEIVAAAQGNRNAFVDAPELAETLYGIDCSSMAEGRGG